MKWIQGIVKRFKHVYDSTLDETDRLDEAEDGLHLGMEEWDWQTLVKGRDLLKISDEFQRNKFVRSCLEQMKDASYEIDQLSSEYSFVTSSLKDIEEIEALPKDERERLNEYARQIAIHEEKRIFYKNKRNRLSDQKFHQMEQLEDSMPQIYNDIKKTEEYHELIREDLNRLEGEKHAFYYRCEELKRMIDNAKGMVFICVGAIVLSIVMLLILQYGFYYDTQIGMIITVLVGAVSLTILYIKHMEAVQELSKTNKDINRIILLQNTVKIRYVNNRNLLDYYYLKYQIKHAKELKEMWDKYVEEKEERKRFKESEGDLGYFKAQLLKQLNKYQLCDSHVWLHQSQALLDQKEMVEIRHNLNGRRQKLRGQIDYNKRLANEGQKEIKLLVERYPKYAKEISDLVNSYDAKF
ncbi:MAG: hypothetical protein ACRC7V_11545 [Lachnospiraceae bacterium]